jgi:diguanylate cyclase (GGDEF)-like protein
MKQFSKLNKIIPYTDTVFETFYDVMLRNGRLAVFFESEAQIGTLMKKQKTYFLASLEMSRDEMRETYTRLGEYHYKLRIPYIDFIKGAEILQEQFILKAHRADTDGLMGEIFDYFKMMMAYTAKGYLNKMLKADREDIGLFNANIETVDQTYLPNKITLNKINWLKGMLDAIENDSDWTEQTKEYFEVWKKELEFIPEHKRAFFKDMEQRILYDTQNLFFFLKKQEYTEILPLYTSLLNIYKLSLIMNNAMTIEYANKVIHDMKLDQLTLLFRKELFETMIVKEMALVQRDPQYRFSVAFLDLDDFKNVNDTYGHFGGDRVLETLGKIIRSHTRISDMGFRIGGDEIALLLKDASAVDAKRVCQKIKDEFTAHDFTSEGQEPFSVSISMGINEYNHENQKPFEVFYQEIDQNLYAAKDSGKNRIVAEAAH